MTVTDSHNLGDVLTMDTMSANREYVFGRAHNIVDGKKNFGTGKGRYINGSKRGKTKANAYIGMWDDHRQGFAVRVKAKPSGCRSKIGVKSGKEFIISYGSGYWARMRREKERREETRKR